MIADHIDAIIMFGVGLWMTAIGLGYLILPGNPATQPGWVAAIAGHFRWMGPMLVVIALILAIAS